MTLFQVIARVFIMITWAILTCAPFGLIMWYSESSPKTWKIAACWIAFLFFVSASIGAGAWLTVEQDRIISTTNQP